MDKYDISTRPFTQSEAMGLNPVALAYIGDTVYDLYIRSYVVKNRLGRMRELHTSSAAVVNAAAQAKAALLLMEGLTEQEQYVFRLGRNAKTGMAPKNMGVADYRLASGLECLVGFLYLTGDENRLKELFRIIIEQFFDVGE